MYIAGESIFYHIHNYHISYDTLRLTDLFLFFLLSKEQTLSKYPESNYGVFPFISQQNSE